MDRRREALYNTKLKDKMNIAQADVMHYGYEIM